MTHDSLTIQGRRELMDLNIHRRARRGGLFVIFTCNTLVEPAALPAGG